MGNPEGIADHSRRKDELRKIYNNPVIDRAKIYPKPFQEFLQKVDHPLQILDIGAGAGNNAYYLAQKGHHITAVEPSELIEIAREQHSHPNIDYHSDTLPALTSVQQQYDVILMDSVWHYIDPAERQESLKRISQLLKPNGKLVVIYPTPPSRDFQFEVTPEIFLTDIQQINSSLPKAKQLQLVGEPSVTLAMDNRKNKEGGDLYYCKFLLESAGRAINVNQAQKKPYTGKG